MYIHTQSRLTSAIPSLPSWLLVISILISPLLLLPVIIIISCHPIPFSNAARGGIHSVLSLCLSSTGCFLLLPMRNYLFPSLHLFIQIFCIIHNRAGFVNRFLQIVTNGQPHFPSHRICAADISSLQTDMRLQPHL